MTWRWQFNRLLANGNFPFLENGEFSGLKDVHRRSIFFSRSALRARARTPVSYEKNMNICEQANQKWKECNKISKVVIPLIFKCGFLDLFMVVLKLRRFKNDFRLKYIINVLKSIRLLWTGLLCMAKLSLLDGRVRSFWRIRIGISDPRSLGSWCTKSYQRNEALVHRISYHDNRRESLPKSRRKSKHFVHQSSILRYWSLKIMYNKWC